MQGGDLKLKTRLQSLATIGAIPSAAFGAVGDFFSPIGGWVFVGAAGALACVVAVILLATLSIKGERFFSTVWARMTVETPEGKRIWNPARPWTSHALHVVGVFGLVCFFIAGKSFAASKNGGVLAAKVPGFAAAQVQLGLTEKMYEEARKTNATLDRIDSKADNFKRERSDDPRKELSNSGVQWEAVRLERAIKDGDTRTVDLFLQGGMPVSAIGAIDAFGLEKPEIANLIISNSSLFDGSRCKRFLTGLDAENVLSASTHGAKLIESLSDNDKGRAVAKEYLNEWRQRVEQNRADYKRQDASRVSAKECIRVQSNDAALASKAVELGSPTRHNTLNDYQFMLAAIQAAVMVGRTDFSKQIKQYCDKQAIVPERGNDDDKQFNSWKIISDLVN